MRIIAMLCVPSFHHAWVLVLHDVMQLLLLLPLLLSSYQHLCVCTCLTVTATFWLKLVPFAPCPPALSRWVVRLGLVRALRVGRARGAPFTA